MTETKSHLSQDRRKMIEGICNLMPVWLISIYLELCHSWYWLILIAITLGLLGSMCQKLVTALMRHPLSTPLSFSRKALCWILTVVLSVGCCCIAFASIFNIAVGIAIAIVLTIVFSTSLSLWVAQK